MTSSDLRTTYAALLILGICLVCHSHASKKAENDDVAVSQRRSRIVSDQSNDSSWLTVAVSTEAFGNGGGSVIYLKQGWTDNERETFYYLDQGSQLVPYNWFIHLTSPDGHELVKSDRNMALLGFIPRSPSERNPDGLPIGFVKNANPPSISLKAAEYGREDFPIRETDWLGLTCAACHTANLTYQNQVIRIDGGSAMADLQGFLALLAQSMKATANDKMKFAAFTKRVVASAGGNAGASPPLKEFQSFTAEIEALVERNKSPHPYGLARLDAFGAILNQITEASLKIPENRRPSSAPVSYPCLWDAPHMDWVQWNSAAEIPIARNVGEVLGVFGHVTLTNMPADGYESSARLDNLHRLEVTLRTLKAPPWPAKHFGEIHEGRKAAGQELFAANCAGCHNSRDEHGNFDMTHPNVAGHRFIKTTSVPFNKIGTDPQMVVNFATRTAKPGILADAVAADLKTLKDSGGLERIKALRAQLGMPAPDFEKEVPASLILREAVRGVTQRYLADALRNRTDAEKKAIMLDLRGGRLPTVADVNAPDGGTGYRARPLNGIWATAPYLHNGSVPNLCELLKPENKRVKSFYVGSREFDPVRVGLKTDKVPGAFLFGTVTEDGKPIPGNSNLGHSGHRYTQTKDKVTGEWRDFTDEEITALIEYMKSLK